MAHPVCSRESFQWWIFVISTVLSCTGCKDQSGIGHLEVKTTFAIRDGDVYTYDEKTLIANSDSHLDTVVTVPVGDVGIFLRRDNKKYRICATTVKKDRIVSVTIDRAENGVPFCVGAR